MNETLHRVLLNQSKRYKTNYERHETYKQLYEEAVTTLQIAQIKRQKLLTNLEQLEENPARVKETIGLYDRIIIPELKRGVKEADNKMIRYGTVNWYDLDFILFISVAVILSVPCIVYGGIIGTISASVLFVTIMWSWVIYRCVLRKMAFEVGESK
jgi:hypothetical protein